MYSRRDLLQLGASGWTAAVASTVATAAETAAGAPRTFHFEQIDVFASERLQGNPLAVFTDARGLSDLEMQAIARETSLQETTFITPRDPAVENASGVKVRIFTPDQELPFAGHPTLGTAMVLRNRALATNTRPEFAGRVVLDLQVGSIPVTFTTDASGQVFGEIAIRSPHVALGYWNRPKLTAAAFRLDPTGGPTRVYRTGDLGRLLPDGNIEFRGRRDLQTMMELQREINVFNQLFEFLGGSVHIDGAFDKMFARINDREFPLRLLPPYAYVSDEQFRQFAAALRERLPQWLPEAT